MSEEKFTATFYLVVFAFNLSLARALDGEGEAPVSGVLCVHGKSVVLKGYTYFTGVTRARCNGTFYGRNKLECLSLTGLSGLV
jgi:hypothetical protein